MFLWWTRGVVIGSRRRVEGFGDAWEGWVRVTC